MYHKWKKECYALLLIVFCSYCLSLVFPSSVLRWGFSCELEEIGLVSCSKRISPLNDYLMLLKHCHVVFKGQQIDIGGTQCDRTPNQCVVEHL